MTKRMRTFVVPPGLEEVPEAMDVWKKRHGFKLKRAYSEMINVLRDKESRIRGDLNKKRIPPCCPPRRLAASLPQSTENENNCNGECQGPFVTSSKSEARFPATSKCANVCSALFKTLQPEAPSLFFRLCSAKHFSDGSPAVVQISEEKLGPSAVRKLPAQPPSPGHFLYFANSSSEERVSGNQNNFAGTAGMLTGRAVKNHVDHPSRNDPK